MAAERIVIDAGATVLVLGVGDDGRLHQLGLGGPELADEPQAFPTLLYPLAYPTFGEEVLREPALRVTHGDGATGTRLVVAATGSKAHGLGTGGGVDHKIGLTDRVAPFGVELTFRTWPEHGVIEQFVQVWNAGDRPCTLHHLASASPALGGQDPWFTHWGGGWANEWTETTEPVTRGVKTVASAGGVRSSLHLAPVVLFHPDGRAGEADGKVLAATVSWGGDVFASAELGMHRAARLLVGVQHRGAEWTLEPGERYVEDASVLLAWSDAGVGPTSRAFHRWTRAHCIRDGDGLRDIVFNNWEAMGFALDTAGVSAVVDGAAVLGAELFLLDDGWFGTTHPRDDDHQGLGDWAVDPRKFPEGLAPVIDHTLAAGMRFGLWVEPEMVNPRSELYEAHPDWVIAEPDRDRREERQQLVLDLCRPEVRDFVVDVIDRAVALHPGITYLKWDANRDVFEAGSMALPADRQAHLPIQRVVDTRLAMAEVAERHPDVELMLCASGGGRSDLANLQSFHELWTSDNTDPVDRVRIQWGASHLLPAQVLGAHVTRWGQKPVPFACAVAMSARFGFDLDPRTMTDDERDACRAASAAYRRIRPLVQHGDLYRLVSPVGSPHGALAYLAAPADGPAADAAVVFAFTLEDAGHDGPPIAVPGLDPDETYAVEVLTPGSPDAGTTATWTGSQLADGALGWPGAPAPAASVWLVSSAR